MITFKQGLLIAEAVKMRYEYPMEEYGETIHTFHEDRMINCCWVQHTFDLAESVQDCLSSKVLAQEE